MNATRLLSTIATALVLACGIALGQETPLIVPAEPAPTASLLTQASPAPEDRSPHGLRNISMFALVSPEARIYQKHDLIQIVVRETSLAKSTHELTTEKDWNLKGDISAWPNFQLDELLQLIIRAGRTSNLPRLDLGVSKDFEGDGEYKRQDDLTARLTAEVMEVLPNGFFNDTATTEIYTDDEQSVIKVTGICRAEDVTPANTILSNQLHDLKISKEHQGELREANKKGIIAKVLDTIFAF
jgi:flagellar L-ring protein precursor FlgH